MMTDRSPCLIAADSHLTGTSNSSHRSRAVRAAFFELLERVRSTRARLYLLGDVFHYWFGRRHLALDMFAEELAALRACTDAGSSITIIPGNRDFLLDSAFARRTGVTVAGDAVEVRLGRERVHLSHGDLFCTSDLSYKAMRRLVRTPGLQSLAHHAPTAWIERLARGIRDHSEGAVGTKPPEQLAPDLGLVAELFERGFDTVICGHFHRRVHEVFPADSGGGTFRVLEPFDLAGYVLEWSSSASEREEGQWTELRLAPSSFR